MRPLDAFSPSYAVARQRFRDAAAAARARLQAHDVEPPADGRFTIDVATLGAPAPRWTVVVSSGLHGVEGFYGSAVQLAWLARRDAAPPADGAVVLAHALNPYGFAHLRRTDAGNVDLNRNFLPPGTPYTGAPPGYAALDRFLNPRSPPPRLEPFRLQAAWLLLRHGMPALTQAVAGGQYHFPRGLFYGGAGPAAATEVVQRELPAWAAGAQAVAHLDLHTGLGAHGACRLLLERQAADVSWYERTFGAGIVEPPDRRDRTAYEAAGTLGGWALARMAGLRYRFVTAEVGTYPALRVLAALRAENRAHFHGAGGARAERCRAELLECFCPRSPRWRVTAVEQGLALIDAAVTALQGTPP